MEPIAHAVCCLQPLRRGDGRVQMWVLTGVQNTLPDYSVQTRSI